MQQTGEGTKSGAFDFSAEFTLEILRNIEKVADHPDMIPALAEELSTPHAESNIRATTLPSRRRAERRPCDGARDARRVR